MKIERKFPHIILTSQSTKGNYFGAFAEKTSESKKGYVVFLSTTKDETDYCECMGFVHGKNCYHLDEARNLSQKLMLGFTKRGSGE